LIGPNGSALHKLEQHTRKTIYVKGAETLHVEDVEIITGDKKTVEERAFPVRPGEVVDIQIEEAHITNPNDGIARIEGYVIDVEGGGRHVGQRHKVEITRVFRTYAKAKLVAN
jgi:Predicted RNA-binding protein, contains TRAM domain